MVQKTPKRKIQTTLSGARFVWRVSKYTGRRWKQYLPRRTQVLRSNIPAARGIVYVPWR